MLSRLHSRPSDRSEFLVEEDLLGSAASGPFPPSRAFEVPSYFEDNLLALRHWQPPGA